MSNVRFITSGALRKAALRQANERLVLDAIRRHPGISRAELARRAGFAPTSVAFVVDRLLKAGLIRENKPDRSPRTSGRPPTALHLLAAARHAVGIEVARPCSRVVLTDLEGAIRNQTVVAFHADTKKFFDALADAVRTITAAIPRRQILGVGASIPGTLDKESGCVLGAESLGWFNVDVGALLRRKVKAPVLFDNDANLCALAEQWYAPVDSAALRYFVYVGAKGGLGTGVVVDGHMLHGAASAGSEFGHVMLYPDGRPCRCGNRGCWEQYASDAALVRCYRELCGRPLDPEPAAEEASRIVQKARQGHSQAVQALRITARYLALGFANLVAAFNPQAIILGEPYAPAWDLIQDVLRAEMSQRVPAYCMEPLRLMPSRIGPDAALRGAAALVLARFFTSFNLSKKGSSQYGVSMRATA